MTSLNPSLSFVLPTLNRAYSLASAIESIREQTFKNWELIIVDDGSTDSTCKLCNHYVNIDKRIKYFRLPENKGIAYARNYGNRQANAKIIAVQDSDDLSHPDRAQITIDYFKKHPETDIFYGSYIRADIFGNPVDTYRSEPTSLEILRKKQNVPHLTVAYKRSVILKHPYNDAHRVNDDYPLVYSWMEKGLKFGKTSKILAKYRQLADGVSLTHAKEVNEISKGISKDYQLARTV